MMMLQDVLNATRASARKYAGLPEMDPLTEQDALQEAQLLDVRLDAVRGQLGILFELRTALQLREPNTGVLVARGVRQFEWNAPPRATVRTAWSVGGSRVDNRGGLFRLDLGLWPGPGAGLALTAESALFMSGDVQGLSEVPPDYTEDDASASEQVASWGSVFSPSAAVFLDPIESL